MSREAAEKFARANGLLFVGETSSLSNVNVKEVMDSLLEQVWNVQSDLVKKGMKSRERLRISEEEEMFKR